MQTLTAQEYENLTELVKQYRDVHMRSMKGMSYFNPRLGFDALCFEHVEQGGAASLMVGALITPCSMWLVALPSDVSLNEPLANTLALDLPSGRYLLNYELLIGGSELYKRLILEDLSGLGSMQEAARLAQRMMVQIMVSNETQGIE
ncbi:[NiFe]-hydrogenase assembly chaperone HybE [Vreelandella zhaodongensis]|uniref:[NiFe]-hydrogenase assembly chaperone HybE n=1 Tax=Vreelandella zhaodongensis TaxID=1176240 RepID=UPI003EC03344